MIDTWLSDTYKTSWAVSIRYKSPDKIFSEEVDRDGVTFYGAPPMPNEQLKEVAQTMFVTFQDKETV